MTAFKRLPPSKKKRKFMPDNVIPVPAKVKEKLLTYITEQRRLQTVVEEVVFTMKETLGLDDSYTLTDISIGFVKGPPSDGVENIGGAIIPAE